MAHNVLILPIGSLPAANAGRRDLGLPAEKPGRGSSPLGASDRQNTTIVCRVEALTAREAGALARSMRACGGTASPAPSARAAGRAIVLFSGAEAFRRFCHAARRATPGPAAEIETAWRGSRSGPPPLLLRDGSRLSFDGTARVMGILNVTPDSFSDGGRYLNPRHAVRHALAMADAGADIIDVGAESTRPGASPIGQREEMRRLQPVLVALLPALKRRGGGRPLVSIDTTRAETARRAAALGADLINDISGLTLDPAMPSVAAEYGLPIVLQHLRGTPATMQRAPRYRHLLPEIAGQLRAAIERAVRAGVRPERIVIDPGLGFGKRRRHTLSILRHLGVLKSLGRPILVGVSRKSFLDGGRGLAPFDRLPETLAAEAFALGAGADIIRSHDVRAAARVARLSDAILRGPVKTR